jgi:hypothetical protein
MAKLVEGDEIGVGEPRCDLARFALKLLLFESVDEFDGGEEPDALAMVLDGWTPIAVARCVLPVPGPPTRTTLWASSRNWQRRS